jgi:hypothetical protein
MNEYERRQEERRKRLEAAADKADQKSRQAAQRAQDILAPIPPGQPILVGHHSEKRHRRALEKADNAMRRSAEEADRAKKLRARAAGVGRAGISSDDPDAIEKLQEKLGQEERSREAMKRANAYYRQHGSLDGCPDVKPERQAALCRDIGRYSWIRAPFPEYVMKNAGATIRRLRQRIEDLQAEADRPPAEEVLTERYRIYEDADENRVCFEFADEVTSRRASKTMRSWGFRYSRMNKRYQRHLNTGGRNACELVLKQLQREGILP